MKLKRPSLRISRSLIIILTIVVLAVVVPIGWSRYSEHQFEQEIRSVGGYYKVAKFERFSSVQLIKKTLWYAWSDLTNGQLPGSTRRGAWTNLLFSQTNVDDQWVQKNSSKIKGLPELRPVFRKTRIGDLAIQSLAGADEIGTLDLSGTRVTDQASEAIGSMSSLIELDLSDTQFSDQAIPAIAALRDLQSIDLRNTNVTGAGVAKLIRKTKWVRLKIDGEDFSDEVVNAINFQQGKGIATQFQLYNATDTHLERLSQLNGVCHLDTVQGPELTERSLEVISKLSLFHERFTFLDTSFSREAMSRARQTRGTGEFQQKETPARDTMWEKSMRVKW